MVLSGTYYCVLNPAASPSVLTTAVDFSTISEALNFYHAHVTQMPLLKVLRISATRILDVTPSNSITYED